jgi:hypothetical protein
MTDNRTVTNELTAISPARRRRMVLALAPVGLVLLLTGVLAVSLDGLAWKLAGLLVVAVSVVLLGVAWGLHRSAALTEAAEAEHRLDEVLTAAAAEAGVSCGPAGAAGGPAGSGAACGTTGLVCGSSSDGVDGGCGACLARTR